MSNSWFRFKQFTIQQDRCAMKVGTDGVLLGTLAGVPRTGKILDVGTGTGLVALMFAQRSPAQIHAVELDSQAAAQAGENVRASPWTDRIRVIHADFLDYYPACRERYELVVSNPPYFRNSLPSEEARKALARHGSDAFFSGLLTGTATLLRPAGRCCFILPAGSVTNFVVKASQAGLHLHHQVNIRSRKNERVIRQLLTMGRSAAGAGVTESELVIYRGQGEYTPEFTDLLHPFYLNL